MEDLWCVWVLRDELAQYRFSRVAYFVLISSWIGISSAVLSETEDGDDDDDDDDDDGARASMEI